MRGFYLKKLPFSGQYNITPTREGFCKNIVILESQILAHSIKSLEKMLIRQSYSPFLITLLSTLALGFLGSIQLGKVLHSVVNIILPHKPPLLVYNLLTTI